MFRCLMIAAMLIAAPISALAQEEWPETEVVVRGKAVVGPALWRVSDGDSQVIILGVLPVFPKKQKWNTKRIENALRGANRLITPADTSTGVGDAWSLMTKKGLPDRQTLKGALPAELYARYERTAKRAGIPIKDFAKDKPVWAGARLRREVLQKYGLSDNEPVATVKGLARAAGVPVKAAGRYDIGPIFKAVNAMDDDASEACLVHTLDDIDFDIDRAPLAARAWAVGDIGTVRANYQGSALMKCLSGSPGASAMLDRSVNDSVAAVSAALAKPGKTVAVFPLAILLRKGGVLERLRARGYSVSAPQD